MATCDVQIVDARYWHAPLLAPVMRDADAAEVKDAMGWDPLTALMESLAGSDVAYTVLFDRMPAAMFGAATARGASTLAPRGIAWALTGKQVDRHRKEFLGVCRPALELLLRRYAELGNMMDARYAAAVRWARWLGFEVGDPVAFGVSGLPFHPIRVRRSPWAV